MRACSPMLSPAVPSERTPTCPETMAGSSHNGHQYSLTVEQRFEAPLRFQRKHFYSTILLRHCVPGCIFSRDVSASVSAPADLLCQLIRAQRVPRYRTRDTGTRNGCWQQPRWSVNESLNSQRPSPLSAASCTLDPVETVPYRRCDDEEDEHLGEIRNGR